MVRSSQEAVGSDEAEQVAGVTERRSNLSGHEVPVYWQMTVTSGVNPESVS
jgi:hypothetical protein